jgi:uncharacterized membrane protein
MYSNMSGDDRILAGFAYAVAFPSIYIILSEKRRDAFVGYHGAQAMFLWIGILVIWIGIRVFLNFLDSVGIYFMLLESLSSMLIFALWIYSLYCGFRAYNGDYFDIPFITELTKKNF